MNKKLISFLFTIFPLVLLSQVKNEVWTDYIHDHYLNSKWVLFGDATFRVGENYVVGIRPSVKYILSNKVSFRAGIGNNYTFDSKDNISNIEIRPWQGVRAVWPSTGIFAIQHYVRVEEQYTTNSFTQDNFEGSIRLRYQLGTDVDIWESASGNHEVNLPLEYEVFSTLGHEDLYINRDRFIAGISYKIRGLITIEFNYVLQREGEGLRNMNTDKNIYRIRIRQTFSKRLKKVAPAD